MAEVQAKLAAVRFDEAISYLKGKLPEASLRWDSLDGVMHAKVFSVAGATSADLAAELQGSLVQALSEGKTIAAFRKDFDRTVQEHGWTYNGKRGWRTQLIFNANMRSAHMAGRWAQIQANKDRRPWLEYRTAGDSRVRPAHRVWNGLIYAVDDPFWTTHYPPNGWNCRCTVRARTQAELDAKGLRASAPWPTKMRDVTLADGTVVDRVPVGIDPGWDHNVGRSWMAPELALGERLARLPRELQGLVADKALSPAFQEALSQGWKGFREAVKDGSREATDGQIVGYLDSAVLRGLEEAAPGLALENTAVGAFTDVAGRAAGWPAAWLNDLPRELGNYRAVLYDRAAGTLLVVPQGAVSGQGAEQLLGVATLRLDVATNLGRAVGVERLGTATAAELAGNRGLQLLVGRLP